MSEEWRLLEPLLLSELLDTLLDALLLSELLDTLLPSDPSEKHRTV